MTMPCNQEGALHNLSQAVVRMEAGQERQLVLLEKVADQGARVEHLEERVSDLRTDIHAVYGQVRDIELTLKSSNPEIGPTLNNSFEVLSKKIDRLSRFVSLISNKYAVWTYMALMAMTVAGTVLDVVSRFEAIKALYLFFK